MKPSREKLFDALGELVYAVAKADGLIQPEETEKLKELLLAHPSAQKIQWSFDYEHRKNITVEEAYAKALDTCKAYGPAEEYAFLFEAIEAVADASQGIDAEEWAVIRRFRAELRKHFLELDLDDID